MTRPMMFLVLLAAAACDGEEPATPPTEPPPTGPPAPLVFGDTTPITGEVGQTWDFTVTGVDPDGYYRVTLVSGDYVTVNADGTGVFTDNGGIANAGPSEDTALLWHVLYGQLNPPVKTFPPADDDPANPSGMRPDNGAISFGVQAFGGGTVYPVVYVNGGASTFLELDEAGVPIEPYVIGPSITIDEPPPPPLDLQPATPQTVAIGGTQTYTISGLDDAYYYRVTLVLDEYIVAAGDGSATFTDGGAGTANAGASEAVALITAVDATPVDPGAKTVPDPADDPAAPTGISPTAGVIEVSVEGVGEGTIYPVAYRNGGASTFLELDGDGAPIEDYVVGGSLTVTAE